ncbi:hypothetical protein CALVIDRAFT_597437 [Calocera viscosa TUFC12733]|uniref:MICOS complex subunit n=1 Tax=Calocera viscosa (strain TUFC12733) TaxID=1330018 RepID=A0A167NAK6_CALVF|nr:hypothetical protein CALVIDRAFT_597437 [Calocera viscosa TUFC12733]
MKRKKQASAWKGGRCVVLIALFTAGAATLATAYVFSRPSLQLDSDTFSKSSKLPIYPTPTPSLVLIDTPSQLEQSIGHVRRVATRAYTETRGRVQAGVDGWIGVERAVERKVKEIVPAEEPMTPGILYVGVATLTGSVLGRNRLLLRVLLPPTFFLASISYFLPQTSHNLYAYVQELETRFFPSLAVQHTQLEAHASSALSRARQAYGESTDWLAGGLKRGVGAVERGTGVKVGEAFGMVKAEAGKVQAKVEAFEQKAEEKMKEEEPKRLV